MRLTINIDDHFGREIKRMAASRGISISRFVLNLLKEALASRAKSMAVRSVMDMARGKHAVSRGAMRLLEMGRVEDENRF